MVRGKPIKRCMTCGRSADESTNGTKADPSHGSVPRAFVDVAPGSAPRPCRVDGCPGTLDAAGKCSCCAKREAWVAERAPVRRCQICEGRITGSGNRKYCEACGAAKNRVATANAKTKT